MVGFKKFFFFTSSALTEMIHNAKAPDHGDIVIEGDNYKVEYKSSAHFWSIQKLANKYTVSIICVFSIVEYDKGKVNHVSGLTKTTIQRAYATGDFFENTT